MTKSGLIQAVTTKMPHLSARDVEIVVNTIFDSMTDALQGGSRIEIRGFGSFSVRHRRARQGRNPKTGESIAVPPKRVPFFTVGHELKQRVDDGRLQYPIVKTKDSDDADESEV
ncbi:MAG: integration host factor subunit beta [Deltaproteobacteria bacterium RIFOXYA12_FULL_58_15]|nr:MAG: integration host factor subunit beta [Deltaproteobacteria bacterium RIFOXYA12_FULL_58_15]OGR12159.1 MAG: integration host factor subunit beta [Deltaproteobacteria bacterium RIFOXYB12_FULL_58_9]